MFLRPKFSRQPHSFFSLHSQAISKSCQFCLQNIYPQSNHFFQSLPLSHWSKSPCISSQDYYKSKSLLIGPLAYPLWRRQWQPTPVLLPGKSHGWRSLVGCSPWGCEELDRTEWLHFLFSLSCIGEGNGSPLQCACLENPRDRSLVGCRLWSHTESDTTDMT